MEWLDECRMHCRRIKYLSEKIEWDTKPNHAGSLIAQSAVLDDEYVSIPGIYFKGVYTSRPLTGDVYSFALMAMTNGVRYRVFMLEVYPKHHVSHRERGLVLQGPHVHLGDERLAQVTKGVFQRGAVPSIGRWIERFRRHSRVHDDGDNRLIHPLSGTLFE